MSDKTVSAALERPPVETQVHLSWWSGDVPQEVREAEVQLKENPESIEVILSLGQEFSKAGMFREAIDVYSRGIALNNANHLLFRHRGHRYISTRRYHEAVADLKQAAVINPNFWETFYHLGLAYYLLGEFRLAEEAYARCLEVTETEKRLCAVADWYYLTLMLLGKKAEAQQVVNRVSIEAEAGENEAYKQRIMVYRGILPPEDALSQMQTENDHTFCTSVYGIGMEYYFRGEKHKAREVFRSISNRSSWWHGFAELAVMADEGRLIF